MFQPTVRKSNIAQWPLFFGAAHLPEGIRVYITENAQRIFRPLPPINVIVTVGMGIGESHFVTEGHEQFFMVIRDSWGVKFDTNFIKQENVEKSIV